jgi:hypothetical protein
LPAIVGRRHQCRRRRLKGMFVSLTSDTNMPFKSVIGAIATLTVGSMKIKK